MLSIVIPAYNEEKRIEKTLDDYYRNLPGDSEIIVVLDGCKDDTVSVINAFMEKIAREKTAGPKLIYIKNNENRGKGFVTKQGILSAKGDLIGFVDADDSTKASEMVRLSGLLSGYDGVIGSRWVKGAVLAKKQPWKRRMASRAFNLCVRILFGMNHKDTQCAAKIFKKGPILSIASEMISNRFAFDVELLYRLKRKGYKIRELPVAWDDCSDSRVNVMKEGIRMFTELLKIRMYKY